MCNTFVVGELQNEIYTYYLINDGVFLDFIINGSWQTKLSGVVIDLTENSICRVHPHSSKCFSGNSFHLFKEQLSLELKIVQ